MIKRLLFVVCLFILASTVFAQSKPRTWYRDADGDGWGISSLLQVSVTQPPGYVLNKQDCNDSIVNQLSWITTGTAGFSPGIANYTDIAIDSNGTPYVVFTDSANGNRTTVMKYAGSSWQVVGTAGFSGNRTSNNHILINSKNLPYVVYTEGTDNKATVMKFNGTAWQEVGYSLFSVGPAFDIQLALGQNDTPYVAYADGSLGGVVVMKFDGLDWNPVGLEAFSPGQAAYTDIAIDKQGIPYVAFQDRANGNKASVMKFDGAAWQNVGNADFSDGQADYISLAFDKNGHPCVAYTDRAHGYKSTVMAFDGTTWNTMGGVGFSADAVAYSSLVVNALNIPYLAFRDANNNNKVSVMTFDGSAWNTLGSSGLSEFEGSFVALALNNEEIPYVAYSENDKPTVSMAVPEIVQPDTPVIIQDNMIFCQGSAITLRVSPSSQKHDATSWIWYSDNAATALIAAGDSVMVSPDVSTTYYVRGESECLAHPGAIGKAYIRVRPVLTWYEDQDGDGWGNASKPAVRACLQPAGYTLKLRDCNDNNYNNTVWKQLYYQDSEDILDDIQNIVEDPRDKSLYILVSRRFGLPGRTVYTADTLYELLAVKRYDGNTWSYLPEIEQDNHNIKIHSALTQDTLGQLYVFYRKENRPVVKRYNGTIWESVGTPGTDLLPSLEIKDIESIEIGITKTNMPYIFYNVGPVDGIMTTMVRQEFDGTAWQTRYYDTVTSKALHNKILMDKNTGEPLYGLYVYPFDSVQAGNEMQVKKYENGNWVNLGEKFITQYSLIKPSTYYKLALDADGTLYCAYTTTDDPPDSLPPLRYDTYVKKWNGKNWETLGNFAGKGGLQTFHFLVGSSNSDKLPEFMIDSAGGLYVLLSDSASNFRSLKYDVATDNWNEFVVDDSLNRQINTSYYWGSQGALYMTSYTGKYWKIRTEEYKSFVKKLVPASLLPDTPGVLASKSPICLGSPVTLAIGANDSLRDASNWQWYTDSTGTQKVGSGTTINLSPSTTTTYYVRAEGNCLAEPGGYDSVTVQVKQFPVASLQATRTAFCTNKDTLATLTGMPAGGTYSGTGITGNNFNASKLTPGTYTLFYSYTDAGTGCSSTDSITMIVNNCLGISPNSANLVRLYPNPAAFSVVIENTYTDVDMTLYNTLGQPVMNKHFSGNIQLDISGLPAGIYLCIITHEGQQQTIRVIKEQP